MAARDGGRAENKKFSINALNNLSQTRLAMLIKPAGYYNQKASYIQNFLELIGENGFESIEELSVTELRKKFLSMVYW